jgi:hypothetical protein
MSKLVINTGTTPNDGTGDSLLAGAAKINSNFTEIYSSIGDGTTLGIASFTQLNVSGASTLAGITTVTGVTLFSRQLNVSGVSTFAGITTVTGVTLFSRQLNVSGVSTITTVGGTNATYTTGNFTTGNIVTGVVTNISGTNLNYTGIATVGSVNIGATQVISSARQLQNIASLDATTTATIESAVANAPNTFTDLNISGLSTFAGITTVTGVSLFTRQLSVSGVSTFAGITTHTTSLFGTQASFTGVVTATSFSGITTSMVAGLSSVVNGPTFYAYPDPGVTAQSITSGSQQKVTFGLELFDSNNCFTNSRFTPNVAGYYQLNSTVRLDTQSGTGELMITIWKNGSEYSRGWNNSGVGISSTGGWWSMSVSTIAFANGSTDFFEVYVQQSDGINKTITRGSNITWFNGCMIRGA